jgi:hypothetical protein
LRIERGEREREREENASKKERNVIQIENYYEKEHHEWND